MSREEQAEINRRAGERLKDECDRGEILSFGLGYVLGGILSDLIELAKEKEDE